MPRPLYGLQDATATPTSPVSGSTPTIDQVAAAEPGKIASAESMLTIATAHAFRERDLIAGRTGTDDEGYGGAHVHQALAAV